METEVLRAEVEKIKWWHTIDLGNGIITPGLDRSLERLARIKIPEDLSGKTVLDVGAWDGFFSFEAERRGAARVLAIDSFCWNGPGWGTKAGFELARKALSSKVEDQEIDVMELSSAKIGRFDIVLFLGVLYHMKHPLLALEKVADVAKDHLILETAVDCISERKPLMRFYPGKELSNDETNWWGPNTAAVVAMLKTVGFRRIIVVSPPHSLPYRIARAVHLKLKNNRPFFETMEQDRIVVHAWK